MAKTCLKCGYERKEIELVSDLECPHCGAIYAKVEAALERKRRADLESEENEIVEEKNLGGMNITCSNCKANYFLTEDKIPLETKIGKCKKCNSPITVLGKNSKVESNERKDLVETKAPSTDLVPSEPEETKRCDFCGEKILAIAKKCKHCGEMLDVVLRAAEEATRGKSNTTVYMNAANAAVSDTKAPKVSNQKHSFPHGWHFIGCLFTFGSWLIIWILHYLLRDRDYYS